MSFFIILLTFALIVNCGVLILLILLQIPKKDAGGGLAFGGGAADALFGAGSGNALTKITKWATGIFIVLSLVLGMLEMKAKNGNVSGFEQGVEQQQQQGQPSQMAPLGTPPPKAQAPAATSGTTPSSPMLSLPATTNAPPPAATTTNGK